MHSKVILVDEHDREIGQAEKLAAHQDGLLHRAFSIFIFDGRGRLLLQRRAANKYHSGRLWTNTCCSHPLPDRPLAEEAHRKLQHEMGFDCELSEIFQFTYHVKLENGLYEHEFDHVFFGTYNQDPTPNPEEVEDWKWIDLAELSSDIVLHPDDYSYWMKLVLDRVIQENTKTPRQ
jgi:isopentenyl-diphosphate Delta-isomerase